MSVNLEYFRLFCSVARYKSISRAADELHLSQPTVTKELRRLEDQVGFPLFVRHPRGVHLTQEGEYLYRRLGPVMQELLKTEAETEDMRTMKSGTVRVTFNSVVTENVLSGFMKKFQEAYPGIRVVSCINPRSMTCTLLNTGVVNVAFASRPTDFTVTERLDFAQIPLWRPETLHGFSLGVYEDVFLAGPQLAHLANKSLRFKDLAPYPFLFQRVLDKIGREAYLKHIPQSPETRNNNIISEDLIALLKFLKLSQSVAVVTSICSELYEKEEGLFPLQLDEPMQSSEYMLYYSRQSPPCLAAATLIDYFLNSSFFSVEKLDTANPWIDKTHSQ